MGTPRRAPTLLVGSLFLFAACANDSLIGDPGDGAGGDFDIGGGDTVPAGDDDAPGGDTVAGGDDAEPQGDSAPPPVCGDGIVEGNEECDTGIAAGPGACPTACHPLSACFIASLQGADCRRHCFQDEILAPIPGDGCCPNGAGPADDPDCGDPETCGNGVLDATEACDTAIAAGQPGACPVTCTGAGSCGTAYASGVDCEAHCVGEPVAPQDGDGCCSGPVFGNLDDDCPGFDMCLQPPAPFVVTELWRWDDPPLLLSTNGNTASTPLVGQFTDDDGDGDVDEEDMPDVLVLMMGISSATALDGTPSTLVLLSGDTGDDHWYRDTTAFDVAPFATPAYGDIDDDGFPEIILGTTEPQQIELVGLVALDHDGAFLWESDPFAQTLLANTFGAPVIADLDSDGTPEIIFGNHVFDNQGRTKWRGADVVADESGGRLAVAVELGGPPGLEVIDGGRAYSAWGELLWEYDAIGYGNPTIADCDLDGDPEILLLARPATLGAPNVVLLDHLGNVLRGPASPGGRTLVSPVAAGDVDGDGYPEFVAAAPTNLIGFGCDLAVELESTLIVDFSGASGPALFDFDGDGDMEIVYADELKAYVFDKNGTKLWDADRPSLTGLETPLVADVNHDGHADLLIPQARKTTGLPRPMAVIAYTSGAAPWMGTTSVWNQHAYHIFGLFEDGTVPLYEGEWWRIFNGFRANVSFVAPTMTCP